MNNARSDDTDFNPVVLPSQYWSATAAAMAQPEKRLMAAVLEEAIAIVALPATTLAEETRAAAREARIWLASEDAAGPFSFASICDVLGLDPGSVRDAVARIQSGDNDFVRPRLSAGRGRHRIRQRRRRTRRAA